ncbi:MAG: ribonuclease HII [Cohaesibacteraceae bacterium]
MAPRSSPKNTPADERSWKKQTEPDVRFEADTQALGFRHVAGVDEAGRGPLAGPVVAAAVILPLQPGPSGSLVHPPALDGLNDSKKITEGMRDQLFAALMELADVSIASVSAQTIDARNIRKASLEAMRLAVVGLPQPADFALIDGTDVPAGLSCAGQALVKGDGRSLSIAAASICAKVTRDRMMLAADARYPGYGFASHKGYATPQHQEALARLGPSPIHRRTFAPVRAAQISRTVL